MSKTMNIELQLKNKEALFKALKRMNVRYEENGVAKFWEDSAEGIVMYFKDWEFPAVVDAETGVVKYDDMDSSRLDKLNELKAYYGIELAKAEALKKGYTVTESVENNKLVLRIGMG